MSNENAKEEPSFRWVSRPDKKGKFRRFAEPNDAMRDVHRGIIVKIRNIPSTLGPDRRSSFGFAKKRSILHNVKRHTRSRYFYSCDIKDAFPSTPIARLADELDSFEVQLSSTQTNRAFLNEFCCGKDGGLAVGAPASPIFFDFYCTSVLDPLIRQICHHSETVYTRYSDDITISSENQIPRILRRRVREAVQSAGFSLKNEKSELIDLKWDGSVTITGVTLLRSGKIVPSSSFVARLYKQLELVEGDGGKEIDRARLVGMYAHLSSFDTSSLAVNVQALLQRIQDWFDGRHLSFAERSELPRPIPQRVLDAIREQIPIEDLVGRLVKLRKQGGELIGLCPFHSERTPSFTVNKKKGFYHCFGCDAHGSVIDFHMQALGENSFRESVATLLQDYCVSVY